MILRNTLVVLFVGAMLVPSAASALDISMVSGLYRAQKDKLDGTNNGGQTTFDVGGRVSGPIDQHLYWLGEGALTLRSYDAPTGGRAPDDSTSLRAGGGVRYYFSRFSEFSVPYVQGLGNYRNDKNASADGSTESETSGLFYGADAGIRFGFDKDFFLDLETPLFDSALFATEKSETTTATGTKTKKSRSRTELYVNTTGALASVKVALGLKL